MAFLYKAERKIVLADTEDAKNSNLGPASYQAHKPQSKQYHRWVAVGLLLLYFDMKLIQGA